MHKVIVLMCMMMVTLVHAQKDAHRIYDGNNHYRSGRIPEAAAAYADALTINPANRKANFNMGTALYRNAQLIKSGKLPMPPNANMTPDSLSGLIADKAIQNFESLTSSVSNPDTLQKVWHNIGNCYLLKKDYKKAADAYKKALKLNPKDEESRYNLAFALKHMPPEQKSGGGGQQNQQQNQQDKKDQKKEQQQPSQMNKEQAEQMMKRMLESERKLQDRRKQKAENPSSYEVEKDW